MGHTKIRTDLFIYFNHFLVLHSYALLCTSLISGDHPAVKFQKTEKKLWRDLTRHTNLANVEEKQAVSHSLVPYIFLNKNPFSTYLYKFSQGGVHTSNAHLPVLAALLTCKRLKFRRSKPLFLDCNALLPWNNRQQIANQKSTTVIA